MREGENKTMGFPVAMIPYSNMAPFRQLGSPEGGEFLSIVPRLSVEALREKKVFAAAVPVGGLFSLKEVVQSLGGFGIAAKERSMSVLLFSDKPIHALRKNDRIHLSGESESSVRLLYLLLGYELGFDFLPVFSRTSSAGDVAELVIGDAALVRLVQRNSDAPKNGRRHERPFVMDLASLWFEIHALPFVFARWVVRKDAPDEVKQSLLKWLNTFKEKESGLVMNAIPTAAKDLGLEESFLEAYFKVIRRSFTEEDWLGEEKFTLEFERFSKGEIFKK